MAKGIIGIDIADFSIEAVILDRERKGYKVQNYSRVNIVPEIVEDGNILDKEKFKTALKQLFSSAQPKPIDKPSDYNVFLSIPESKVFSKVLSIPKNLKDKKIEEVVRRRAEEVIPEDFDNLLVDMKILGDSNDDRQIFFTAAEKGVVAQYVSIFDDLRMEVEGITSEAISSFAGLSDALEKTTTLLLDMGSRTTIASIFDSSGIRDSININIAGNNIDNALSQKMGIPNSVANERKQNVGLDASSNDGEVMLIIQGQLQPLADELKRFINYFQTAYNQKIEQIVLIGGLAQMKGIDKYFGDNLSIPTVIGYSFIDANFLPKPVANTKFINALGLAKLGHKKPEINFYSNFSREIKEEEAQSNIQNNKDQNFVEGEEEITEVVEKKSSFKIKPLYIIFILLLIIMGVLGFVFKDKILENLGYSTKESVVMEDKQNAPVTPTKDVYYFNKPIVVSNENLKNATNFIPAEEFVSSQTINTAGVDEEYINIIDTLYKLADIKTLADFDISPNQEGGYYVFPDAVRVGIKSIIPSEEDYKKGDSLTAEADFIFLKVYEQDIDEYLMKVIPTDEVGQLSNWKIEKEYQVLNVDPSLNSLDIMVNITLRKK